MMNETLRIMHSHRSVRSYTSTPLSDTMLASIVEAARCGPTSINGQQVSLVVVRDPQKRARIAEIAGGQPWIAQAPVFITVVIDFHKTYLGAEMAGAAQIIHQSVEGMVVGCVDAGIALANLITAAHALGLGAVPIGGIRNDPQAMIDLLELPHLTFPVVGVCIGHIDQDAIQKPRLPIESFRHDERYRRETLAPAIAAYDQTLINHWKTTGRSDGQRWSESVANFYKTVYFPNVKIVAAKQGFSNDQ